MTTTIFAHEERILTTVKSPFTYRQICTGDNPSFPVIQHLVSEVARAEREIEEHAAAIENKLNSVRNQIKNGTRLNSLGELQRVPVELDQAVIRRELAFEALGLAVNALKS